MNAFPEISSALLEIICAVDANSLKILFIQILSNELLFTSCFNHISKTSTDGNARPYSYFPMLSRIKNKNIKTFEFMQNYYNPD